MVRHRGSHTPRLEKNPGLRSRSARSPSTRPTPRATTGMCRVHARHPIAATSSRSDQRLMYTSPQNQDQTTASSKTKGHVDAAQRDSSLVEKTGGW